LYTRSISPAFVYPFPLGSCFFACSICGSFDPLRLLCYYFNYCYYYCYYYYYYCYCYYYYYDYS
jgi:hypothetical protein